MARSIMVVLVVVLGASGAATAAASGVAVPNLCVGAGPHCYATIQAAINAAHNGDTIRIRAGTFAGGITITKSLRLVGARAASTRIRGGGPVVTIGSATTSPTVTIARVVITGGVTTTDPQAPACGPDVPTCGPGYTSATALGGGIEAFPGTTVTLLRSVVTRNRAVPAMSVPSVHAVCPGPAPCPASFGDAAGIDNWGTMTLIRTTVSRNYAAANQSDGGGIVDEGGASLTLDRSAVTGNTASAAPLTGRFASGGAIFVDGGASITVDRSRIDGNATRLSSSIPSPYPEQEGGTDQASAYGAVFVSDGSTAAIRNSTLDWNTVTVNAPPGQPYGSDAALCACGNVPLTLENSRLEHNRVGVDVLSSDANGPSGPGTFEADGNATIRNTRIDDNAITVRTPTGDAATIGAIGFFFGGTVTPTITNSSIDDNTSTAVAPAGEATTQGAGVLNNGPLVLTNVAVSGNRGAAIGLTGFAAGGGIWNGVLFGGPTSPLTLRRSRVTRNILAGSPGLTLRGGGIFTPGFPLTLQNSLIAHNVPDQCFGC